MDVMSESNHLRRPSEQAPLAVGGPARSVGSMTENVVTRAVYRPLWSDDESSMWSDEESVQGVSVRSSPAKLTRSPLRRTPTKQRSPLAVLSPNKPVEAAAAPAAAAKARGRFRDPATPVFRQQIQVRVMRMMCSGSGTWAARADAVV